MRYTGPTPDRGRMNAMDVGPAIMAMGELMGRTSRIVFGDQARVRVDVQADFPHASFGIEFFLVAPFVGTLHSASLGDLANIATILGLNLTSGVIGLLKWQRGRKIDKVERVGDQVNITAQNSTITVTTVEYNVYIDAGVRTAIDTIIAPLEQEGVETLELRANNDPPAIIDKADATTMAQAPLPDDEVLVDRSQAILEIVAISFREGNKWRFAQGGATFYADITDEGFLDEVAKHGELFGARDALRVILETRTIKSAKGGFEYQRTIVNVLEHIRADRGDAQLSLDAER